MKIQINTLEIAGFHSALQALHLPFGKGCSSMTESQISIKGSEIYHDAHCKISDHDLHLLSALVRRGDQHSKVVRGIVVYAMISAPIWFYRELETYRFGRERLSSESTMHINCKGLAGAELEAKKDEISMGWIQKTVDMYSYQTLRRIYRQRRDHRLPMWHDFCAWIETLPYFEELILGE